MHRGFVKNKIKIPLEKTELRSVQPLGTVLRSVCVWITCGSTDLDYIIQYESYYPRGSDSLCTLLTRRII